VLIPPTTAKAANTGANVIISYSTSTLAFMISSPFRVIFVRYTVLLACPPLHTVDCTLYCFYTTVHLYSLTYRLRFRPILLKYVPQFRPLVYSAWITPPNLLQASSSLLKPSSKSSSP